MDSTDPNNKNNNNNNNSNEIKEYFFKLNSKFPIGVLKSIPFMRKGEKSKISIRPKYGCKKKIKKIKKFF